ncbi:MAG: hypothetical protein K6A34_03665, partial [Methanobrevibacter sp.]|nr:hypothetical protein [Methanobrevibacter sp.]
MTLAKTMSYPLFLFLVNISGLSYKFCLSVFWIIASLVLTYGIQKFVCKNKLVLLFSFVFIIFLPIAFDSWGGTRIYRNSILVP